MRHMKTNNEIRRSNLVIAIERFGTAKQLAEAADVSTAYLSQVKNRQPDSKTGKPKYMGDEVARKIESALGEAPGWMDKDHSAPMGDPDLYVRASNLRRWLDVSRPDIDRLREKYFDLVDHVDIDPDLARQIEADFGEPPGSLDKRDLAQHVASIAWKVPVAAGATAADRQTIEPPVNQEQPSRSARYTPSPAARALLDAVIAADKLGITPEFLDSIRAAVTHFAMSNLRGDGTFDVEDESH